MKKILVLGAGNIGEMITVMLADADKIMPSDIHYHVTVADFTQSNLDNIVERDNVETMVLDVTDEVALITAMAGKYAVLTALPFQVTPLVAKAARLAGVNYFDLTEDVASTKLVKNLVKGAITAFMPQCGLAPGFIAIVAHDLASRFDTVNELQLRVGALPQYPSNSLGYNLTWSTDGVINEYIEPCEAIVGGQLRSLTALEGLETMSLDGDEYEAFNTSGGLGTMCETYAGRIDKLNYKTMRYPGHCAKMKFLINDMKLGQNRPMFKEILETVLPSTMQDVVIVHVNAVGVSNGHLLQHSYSKAVYAQKIDGQTYSAIQITTAAGICTVLDLLVEGKLPQMGFIRQEDVDFQDFINNRFGRYYG